MFGDPGSRIRPTPCEFGRWRQAHRDHAGNPRLIGSVRCREDGQRCAFGYAGHDDRRGKRMGVLQRLDQDTIIGRYIRRLEMRLAGSERREILPDIYSDNGVALCAEFLGHRSGKADPPDVAAAHHDRATRLPGGRVHRHRQRFPADGNVYLVRGDSRRGPRNASNDGTHERQTRAGHLSLLCGRRLPVQLSLEQAVRLEP